MLVASFSIVVTSWAALKCCLELGVHVRGCEKVRDRRLALGRDSRRRHLRDGSRVSKRSFLALRSGVQGHHVFASCLDDRRRYRSRSAQALSVGPRRSRGPRTRPCGG